MGLMSFIKEAGEKLFGSAKAAPAAAAPASPEQVQALAGQAATAIVKYIDAQGLPARAVICLRAYRKMEGVHDVTVLLTAVDQPTQGLLGRFDAYGVGFDNAMKLARHFIQGYGRKAPAAQGAAR